MVPVPKDQGISKGYLRPADGIEFFVDTDGLDRGGYNWKGVHFRVLGNDLVSIAEDGTLDNKGFIDGVDLVIFDESFDYLSISGGGKLYFFAGGQLTESVDEDLGVVLDHVWIDGYTMTTDGEFLVVNDLQDHLSINPLKYGSSEANPDPITALLRNRNEVYALNRHTIEVFQNIGGNYFPFQRIESAQMQRGCVGTHACAVFQESIAFIGGKKNEPSAVWIGINGSTVKLSTREIDTIIQGYSANAISKIKLETRIEKTHAFLYIHLPDQTLVYDANASRELQQHVWFTLTSSKVGNSQYQAKNLVWCYEKWYAGDPTSKRIGTLTHTISSHYGETIGWDFITKIVYAEGRGAIFHSLELVALTGRTLLGVNPTVWSSYSDDGLSFSVEKPVRIGKTGETKRRIQWRRNGRLRETRMQRFRGTSDSHISISRLEAMLEPLNA